MNPLVTVIVPCYNQSKYLPFTLESILNQSYQNWECIIIDDGSPDNTEDIAKIWCNKDKRFNYILQKNLGVSAARNKGISIANGDYVQFLDADDQLEVEKFEHQVHFLEQNPLVDIIYGTSRYFFDGNNQLFATHFKGFSPAIELHYQDDNHNQLTVINTTNISTICATLYRKRIFVDGLKFRDAPYEDYLFHIECAFHKYLFHFERFKKSHCLIRMTKESQMQKHASLPKNQDLFYAEVIALRNKFEFKSDFIEFTDIQFKNKTTFIKNIFVQLTPPAIMKIIKIISNRLFN